MVSLVVCLWFIHVHGSPEQFGIDTGQAISVARGILEGVGPRTFVLYNEVHLSQQIPVYQTVWPHGMSFVSAGLAAATGLGVEHSFLIVALLAHLGSGLLLIVGLRQLRVATSLAMVCGAAWIAFVPMWILVIRGNTASLYALVCIALGVLLLRLAETQKPLSVAAWGLGAALTAGAAVLVRYQGIAAGLPLVSLLGLPIRRGLPNDSFRRSMLLVLIGFAAVTATLLASNYWYTGYLTGTGGEYELRSVAEVAEVLTFLPESLRVPAFLVQVALLIAVTAATLRVWYLFHREAGTASSRRVKALIALTYSVGMLIATAVLIGTLSFVSGAYPWTLRYFISLGPPCVLGIFAFLEMHGLPRRARLSIFTSSLVVMAVAGGITLATYPIATRMAEDFSGKYVKAAIEEAPQLARLLSSASEPGSGTAAATILTNRPSELGIWTRLPVVALPFADSSDDEWTEVDISRLVQFHGVSHVVFFEERPEQWGLDYLARFLASHVRPAWLETLFSTEKVRVYAVDSPKLPTVSGPPSAFSNAAPGRLVPHQRRKVSSQSRMICAHPDAAEGGCFIRRSS